MKIAYVLSWVSRNAGGLCRSVSGLAKATAAMDGIHVQVFGSRDKFSHQDQGEWRPLQVNTAAVIGPGRLCYTPRMRTMIEDFAPDTIHSASVWTYQASVVNQVHARSKTPYVLSTRGTLDAWALRQSRGKKFVARLLYQQRNFEDAACLHALHNSECASMRQLGLRSPICVIPNGVDIPEAWGGHPTLGAGPLASMKAEGRRVLLYLGRIHPKKGLANLLRAWSQVRKQGGSGRGGADWILAIVGWDEGGHENELKALSAEYGMQDSIRFLGPQFGEMKSMCYSACDAYILPSLSEGLPMTVLEAWSHEKPVLMTPECYLPEGFTAGAAIRLEHASANHGTPSQRHGLETGLIELFNASDSSLGAMGRNGRRLVEERFAWPIIAQSMRSVYDWVLGGGTPPSCVNLR